MSVFSTTNEVESYFPRLFKNYQTWWGNVLTKHEYCIHKYTPSFMCTEKYTYNIVGIVITYWNIKQWGIKLTFFLPQYVLFLFCMFHNLFLKKLQNVAKNQMCKHSLPLWSKLNNVINILMVYILLVLVYGVFENFIEFYWHLNIRRQLE